MNSIVRSCSLGLHSCVIVFTGPASRDRLFSVGVLPKTFHNCGLIPVLVEGAVGNMIPAIVLLGHHNSRKVSSQASCTSCAQEKRTCQVLRSSAEDPAHVCSCPPQWTQLRSSAVDSAQVLWRGLCSCLLMSSAMDSTQVLCSGLCSGPLERTLLRSAHVLRNGLNSGPLQWTPHTSSPRGSWQIVKT